MAYGLPHPQCHMADVELMQLIRENVLRIVENFILLQLDNFEPVLIYRMVVYDKKKWCNEINAKHFANSSDHPSYGNMHSSSSRPRGQLDWICDGIFCW